MRVGAECAKGPYHRNLERIRPTGSRPRHPLRRAKHAGGTDSRDSEPCGGDSSNPFAWPPCGVRSPAPARPRDTPELASPRLPETCNGAPMASHHRPAATPRRPGDVPSTPERRPTAPQRLPCGALTAVRRPTNAQEAHCWASAPATAPQQQRLNNGAPTTAPQRRTAAALRRPATAPSDAPSDAPRDAPSTPERRLANATTTPQHTTAPQRLSDSPAPAPHDPPTPAPQRGPAAALHRPNSAPSTTCGAPCQHGAPTRRPNTAPSPAASIRPGGSRGRTPRPRRLTSTRGCPPPRRETAIAARRATDTALHGGLRVNDGAPNRSQLAIWRCMGLWDLGWTKAQVQMGHPAWQHESPQTPPVTPVCAPPPPQTPSRNVGESVAQNVGADVGRSARRALARHAALSAPAPIIGPCKRGNASGHTPPPIVSSGGGLCGAPLDAVSVRTTVCGVGGLVTRRHDCIRRWLAERCMAAFGRRVRDEVDVAAPQVHTTGRIDNAACARRHAGLGRRRLHKGVNRVGRVATARHKSWPVPQVGCGAQMSRYGPPSRRRPPMPALGPASRPTAHLPQLPCTPLTILIGLPAGPHALADSRSR